MICQFIRDNNEQCKFRSTNQLIKDGIIILLCTRHYNKLINSSEVELNNLPSINSTTSKRFLINKINDIELFEEKSTNKLIKSIILNNNNKNVLEYEYKLLKNILNNHENIIKYTNYIINKEYCHLEFDNIPISYKEAKDKINNSKDIIKDIYNQFISVIKYIHSKKLLLLYLNPDNLRFDLVNNRYILKIINFTNCIQYIDTNSRFYENYKLINRHNNDIYGSRNINLGHRGVRIDDIESILYILLDLLDNKTIKKIKKLSQITRIVDKKNKILNTRYNIDFIDNLIDTINKKVDCNNINQNLSNRAINYLLLNN